jgi:hypothetical protein
MDWTRSMICLVMESALLIIGFDLRYTLLLFVDQTT